MKAELLQQFLLDIQYTYDTENIVVEYSGSKIKKIAAEEGIWGEATTIEYNVQQPLSWNIILPLRDNAIPFDYCYKVWSAYHKAFTKQLARIEQKQSGELLQEQGKKWHEKVLKTFWQSTPESIALTGDWKQSPTELWPGKKVRIEFLGYENLWDTSDGFDIPEVEVVGWKINWPTMEEDAIRFEDGLLLWLEMHRAEKRLMQNWHIHTVQYF